MVILMKKIDLATTSRKLHKNHAFNFCDGEHVYPELFFRLNLIQKKEHTLLCEHLLETPEFKEFLQLDEFSPKMPFDFENCQNDEAEEDEDAFERMMHEKKKTFKSDIFDENILDDIAETIDVPIPMSEEKVLNAFKGVCRSMEKKGYLSGVDLAKATEMAMAFMPAVSLKSYEYATLTYAGDTKEAVDFDINRHKKKPLSCLPVCEKAVLLSSAIYATIWDFECVDEVEKCDDLQIQLTDLLSGMPEYFYANAVENVNRRFLIQKEYAVRENISHFMGIRLKNFFSEEELDLSERVHINKAIHQIENLSFDSLSSWNRQVRPLISKISKYTPAYLRKDFLFCAAEDMDLLSGVIAHSDLKKNTWQQVLLHHFSKCFSPYATIRAQQVPQKMKELKNMANKAVVLNPIWTIKEKDSYLDMVHSLNIDEIKIISRHPKKGNDNTGRTYE